ncbi:MAG: restriction endonuclease subunit S, partial [Methylovulum miyakonense]|uniref:restriction endonuclease subunit S n=1 Tax=Methylovulum miyakonense TaxID=645578 RepID=UPI003BB6A966
GNPAELGLGVPGYKQSEVGVIPEDWNPVVLSMITSEIGDGIHSTPTYSPNGEYFFINGNNIRDGRIVVTENTMLVDYSEFKKNKKNLDDRTVLLSINGTIGNLALYAGEAVMLGKSAAYLNVKGEIGKEYVYYYLQTESVRCQFNDGLTGTTIRNLGLATIRNTQIALPPTKAEQEAIAEALSDADALIESLEQLIVKKRQIKQGAMQELLTGKKRLPGFSEDWKEKPISSFSAFVTKGATPTTYGFSWQNNGVLFLRSECVSADGLDLAQSMFISETAHAALIRGEVRAGDILMTITGNVGRVVHLGTGFGVANINQHIARIRVNEPDVSSSFVFHWLSQLSVRAYYALITTGQAYPQISLKQVRETQVPLPLFPEQTAIATLLSDMDAEIAALEAKLAKTRALKQGMMHKLLTGRIRLL